MQATNLSSSVPPTPPNSRGARNFEVKLPALHAGQIAVLSSAKRFNILVAGRRWFKTTLGCDIAISRMLKGDRIIWGAPTYDQGFVAFETIARACHGLVKTNQSRMSIQAPGRGRILVRSLDDPENARSQTADGVILDESADIHPKAWSEVLRAMLMTTRGWAWMLGTPKGLNWFFSEYGKGIDPLFPDYQCWRAPTLGVGFNEDGMLVRMPHPLENPTIPFEEILSMWRELPRRAFNQEVLAEFLNDASAVFRNLLKTCILQPRLPDYEEQGRFVMGVDWGRVDDFTVLSVYDRILKEQVALERFNEIGWELQRGRIAALNDTYRCSAIYAENNSIGSPNIEALIAEGLPVVPFEMTSKSKPTLINDFALAIEKNKVKLLDDPIQFAELSAYRVDRLPSGRYTYNAPSGMHDDTVTATAIAWHAVQYGGTSIIFG